MSEENLKKKKKYTPTTVANKLEIFSLLDKNVPIKEICKKFGITYGCVWKIRKGREAFTEKLLNLEDFKDRKRLKPPKFEKLDKALYYWYTREISLNHTVTDQMIQQKAMVFHAKLECGDNFVASKGFLRNFKRRNGINKKECEEEPEEEPEEVCEDEPEEIREDQETVDVSDDSDDSQNYMESSRIETMTVEEEPIDIVDIKREEIEVIPSSLEACEAAQTLLNWLSHQSNPKQEFLDTLIELRDFARNSLP